MSEEKTTKHFWIIGMVICSLIAILATIDLSGVWRDDPVEKPEIQKKTRDPVFYFIWDVKLCDEVHKDTIPTFKKKPKIPKKSK